MNYCGHCGAGGHNRRTCPRRKKQLTRQAEEGNLYAKAELERKPRARSCGFCHLVGHDKRTCEHLKNSVEELGSINLQVRKEIHRRAKTHNFGVGSLVSVEISDFVDGGYVKSEQYGIVQRIAWDRVGYFDEWDESSHNTDPIVVQFSSPVESASRGMIERYFPFPFEVGYLGQSNRDSFSHWRFEGDLKIVNGSRDGNEGESSLLDLTGCRKQAKQLLKDREWEHNYATRRIDTAKKLVDNFTY